MTELNRTIYNSCKRNYRLVGAQILKIKLFLIVLLFFGPSFSFSQEYIHYFTKLDDAPIDSLQIKEYGVTTGWTIFEDIMFPGTSIVGKLSKDSTKFKGQNVLNCELIGGDQYNNLFFTNTLAKNYIGKDWVLQNSSSFSYQMTFYVDSFIDEFHSDSSLVEGLEFTFQFARNRNSYLWGIQWSKENIWSFWNANTSNDEIIAWVPIEELNMPIKSGRWNSATITGDFTKDSLRYKTFVLNDKVYQLDITIPSAQLPISWVENYIQVGFQINGNKAILNNHSHGVDPVSVFLDEMTLVLK